MQRATPFARAAAMMAAVAAVMQANPIPGAQQITALNKLPAYESRGKGGKRPHRKTGISAVKRAARKARNVRRHRAARG